MVAIPDPDASSSPFNHRRAWLFALFLGLTLAAVASTRVECGPAFLTGGGAFLTGGGAFLTGGGRQCEIEAGRLRIPLPGPLSAWVDAIMT